MYVPVAAKSGLGLSIDSMVVDAIKPRIGELVRAAVPPAIEAIKPKIPEIIAAAGPPLEKYIKEKLYPNTLRPIIDAEVKRAGGTAMKAAALSGAVIGVSVIGFLAYRRARKRAEP